MLAIHHILYPTDFSNEARPAFAAACALARDYGAELTVLHVIPPDMVVAPDGVAVVMPTGERELATEQLEEYRPADPAVVVRHRLGDGAPAEEILKAARDIRADLIVMGTHGRRGLSRLLMGSVAEAVMRKAPCPVMTVRGPAEIPMDLPADEPSVSAGV